MKLHEAGGRIARAHPAGKHLGVLLSLAALIGTASDAAPELQSVSATRPAVQAPAAPIDESATNAFSSNIAMVDDRAIQMATGLVAVINFGYLPGPDSVPGTADDVPYTSSDITNFGGGRLIDDEYSNAGVFFSGVNVPSLGIIGGGFDSDNVFGSGTNTLLKGARVGGVPVTSIGGVAAFSVIFLLPQTIVEVDIFAYLNSSGTSLPLVFSSLGDVVAEETLTQSPQVSGRFTLAPGVPFDQIDFGLTGPSGGGIGIDNLSYQLTSDPLDSDGDGVADAADADPFDAFVCSDVDEDTCDDCAGSGIFDPFDDGPDYDGDGACDDGDPDDDNDNVGDASDAARLDEFVCSDVDLDSCDDCAVAGIFDPSNDGVDTDSDGACNAGDLDDDNDGLSDAAEALAGTDPLNPDSDFDGYEDGEEVAAGTDPTDGTVPGPVAQVLAVYPSPADDGLAGESIEVRGTALVPVYFNNGLGNSTTGNQCTDFGGNEVCGWEILLETTGDLLISGIDWETSVTVTEDTTARVQASSAPDSGGWEGATRIATVAVTGTLGELRLAPEGAGFVDRFGATMGFPDPEGVLLAQASPLPWAGLSVADGRGCGVLGNGSLQCWSAIGPGVFGSPPNTGAYRKVVSSSAPPEFALELDGTLQQWGAGDFRGFVSYVDLVAGDVHRCGLTGSGEAECWDASTGAEPGSVGTPADGPFRMLTRGRFHVCGLRTNGGVACWGSDSDGQSSPPNGAFEALAGGENHTCGIRPGDGSVECWGNPSDGKTAFQAGPFVALSAGSDHTCGIRDDGLVSCWGADALGQLAAPADVFVAISASALFTCGINDQGEILCWGEVPAGFVDAIPVLAYPRVAAGADHACGIAPSGEVSCKSSGTAPSPVPLLAYRAVASGRGFSVLIEDSSLSVDGFGLNDVGQTDGLIPAQPALQIAAGDAHACQLLLDNSIECWGDSSDGKAAAQAGPFLTLSAGDDHTCGILFDGSIECWGSDAFGQSTPPTGVFVQVSSGAKHNCARRNNGTVVCWGDGGEGQTAAPNGAFVHVSAGATHSCGLRPDSRVECWGNDGSNFSTPDALFHDFTAGGDYPNIEGFTCGVRTNGGGHCWGALSVGPPGDEDLDGVGDIVDNCPGVANRPQADGDADGVGDLCDLCPAVPDPDQADRDGDTHGDVCDACPDNANFFEEGDTCLTTVLLQTSSNRASARSMKSVSTKTFEINLVCPSLDIGRLEMGLVMPASVIPATDVTFVVNGATCEDPAAGSCGSMDISGDTVDATQSFVIKPTATYTDMMEYPSFPGDLDTIYFVLEGALVDGSPVLCSNGVETLATVTVPSTTTPDLTDTNIGEVGSWCNTTGPCTGGPSFTSLSMDAKAVTDSNDNVLEAEDYAKAVGDGTAQTEVLLRPRADDGEARSWDVELRSTKAIKRVTLGFILPDGSNADDNHLQLVGCDTNIATSFTPMLTNCSSKADTPDLQLVSVLDTDSYALAYDTDFALVGDVRADTLYALFEGGAYNSSPSGLILNANTAPTLTRLGTVKFTDGTGVYEGDPPVVTLQGVSDLGVTAAQELPVSTLALDDFLLTGTGATGEDYDADASPNDSDNCRYAYNPDQMDQGGVLTIGADGRGDACECGDGNGDGGVGVEVSVPLEHTDVESLQKVLSGQTSTDSPEQTARCSTYGNTACDILDIVILSGAVQETPVGPGVEEVCLRSVSSEVPSDP